MKNKIALISAWNPHYNELRPFWKNKIEYCNKHGYDAVHHIDVLERGAAWLRIKLAMEQLQNYEWLFVLDLDTLITDMDKRLETFLETDSDYVGTCDRNGFNAGAFFLRNSSWSAELLKRVWNCDLTFQDVAEQTTLAYQLVVSDRSKWEIRPQREFNSYRYSEYEKEYEMGEWRSGDFILHMPGMSCNRRLELLRQY